MDEVTEAEGLSVKVSVKNRYLVFICLARKYL